MHLKPLNQTTGFLFKFLLSGVDPWVWWTVYRAGRGVRLLWHSGHQGFEGGGDRHGGDQPQRRHSADQQGAGRQGLPTPCHSGICRTGKKRGVQNYILSYSLTTENLKYKKNCIYKYIQL